MIERLVVMLGVGLSALSGCAVADQDGIVAAGGMGHAGLGPGALAFAEPADLVLGPKPSELIRESASPADLAVDPDLEPMVDAEPMGQEVTEATDAGKIATDLFDSLMTDGGVLPLTSVGEPSSGGEGAASPR